MKKRTLLFIIGWFLLFLCITGCQLVKDETGTHIRLSPQSHKTISDVGDSATGILSILSMFVPALIPVAAAATTGTAVWKTMGKKVTKYRTPLEHTIGAIETIKENPTLYEKIKPYLKGGDIQADRHLSATCPPASKETETTINEIIDGFNA